MTTGWRCRSGIGALGILWGVKGAPPTAPREAPLAPLDAPGPLVDTHAHLTDRRYAGDLDAVLERARAAGVGGIVVSGYDLASSRAAVELAARHDGSGRRWASTPTTPASPPPRPWPRWSAWPAGRGWWPSASAGWTSTATSRPGTSQARAFAAQLELAAALDLPVVVHSREAMPETLHTLARARLPAGGVLHCFDGDTEDARRAVSLGLYLSCRRPPDLPARPHPGPRPGRRPPGAPGGGDGLPLPQPRRPPGASATSRPTSSLWPRPWPGPRTHDLADVARATTANAAALFRTPALCPLERVGMTSSAPAQAFFAPIADDLVAADAAIRAVAETANPFLTQTLRVILHSSGKRLRPALTLLAARLHETTLSRRVELATAAELLHTATLIHDDVIDVSDARRGRPTINASFNNTLAVLTGDYLFGKSGELVSGLGSTAIMGVYSWAVMELVQGEMLRPALNGDLAGHRAGLPGQDPGQDGLPLRHVHPDRGHAGRGRPAGRRAPAGVRPQPGDGLPGGGRRAGLHRQRGRAGEAGGERPAPRHRHPPRHLLPPPVPPGRPRAGAPRPGGRLPGGGRRRRGGHPALGRHRPGPGARPRATPPPPTASLDGLPPGPVVEALHGLAHYVVDRTE